MRSPVDQLDQGVFALRAIRDLLCGADRTLAHVASDDLYFLMALVVREVEEAADGLERQREGRRAA